MAYISDNLNAQKKKIKKRIELGKPTLYSQKYAKQCQVVPGSVFYQAYRNKIMAGNPYAIFRQLMEDPEYKDLKHYWVYADDHSLNDDTFRKYKDFPNVFYIKAGTEEYYKALASCQYLVNNAALPSYWIKKPDQIYINTWHGTPLKTLGRQAKDRDIKSISNAQRNLYMCDYMVMPNQYTVDRMTQAYDLEGIMKGKIIDAGYPRVDLVLHTDQQHIRGLLEKKLGVSLEEKKIVLYAPTFRSKDGKGVNTSEEVGRYMSQMLRILPENYELVFKVHNMMGAFFKNNKEMSSRLIFDEIETNELLSVTDLLITDYSSIFFEFLCRRKPILFFAYDKEEYEGGRGLYRPIEELPGAICTSIPDLAQAFKEIEAGTYDYRERFEKYYEEFSYNDDGGASGRVVDIIWKKKEGMDRYIRTFPETSRVLVAAEQIKTTDDFLTFTGLLREKSADDRTLVAQAKNVYSFTEEIEKISPKIRLNGSEFALSGTVTEKAREKTGSFGLGENYFSNQYAKFYGTTHFDEAYLVGDIKPATRKLIEAGTGLNKLKRNALIRKERKKHVFTVVFLTAFDSTNYVFVNLYKELTRRNIRCLVLTSDAEDLVNNKMFIEAQIPLINIKDFDVQRLALADLIITAPIKAAGSDKLWKAIENRGIFRVSFATLFSSIAMRANTDLVFTVGRSKFDEMHANGLRYSMVAAGNPQYDQLISLKRSEETDLTQIRRVLFVDQGGYPFGSQGKQKLADCLVAMAKYHPEIEITVKPRFLPDVKQENLLHAPSEHVYDYIKECPDNLILLREDTILEDLIRQSDAMITMWSTAYLDAALMNIPLMLIHGLPTIDVFDVRIRRIEDAYQVLKKTGCVAEYQDVLEGKMEFHQVSREMLEKEFYHPQEASSPKIADALEAIYKYLIVPGKRLKNYVETDVETFIKELPGQETIAVNSEEFTARKSFQNFFNDKMQQLVFENRCMANALYLEPLQKYWNAGFEKALPRIPLKAFKGLAFAQIQACRLNLFNPIRMKNETDPIRLDYYMTNLFKAGMYGQILKMDNPAVLEETKEYFTSMVYLKQGQYGKFSEHFKKYYDIIHTKDVHPVKISRKTEYKYFPGKLEVQPCMEALLRAGAYEALKEMYNNGRFNVYVRTYYYMRTLEAQGETQQIQRAYTDFLSDTVIPDENNMLKEDYEKMTHYYHRVIKIGMKYTKKH